MRNRTMFEQGLKNLRDFRDQHQSNCYEVGDFAIMLIQRLADPNLASQDMRIFCDKGLQKLLPRTHIVKEDQ